MMKIQPIHGSISMLISTAFLGIAFLLEGYWGVSVICAAIFLIYLIPAIRSTAGAITWFFFVNMGLAAAGTALDLSIEMLIVAAAAGLIGWDLTVYERGINQQTKMIRDEQVTIQHLKRLGTAIILGLTAVFVSRLIHLELTFALTILLSLLGIAGLSAAYLMVKAQQNPPD